MAYTKILVIHNRLDKCLDYAQDKEKTSLSLCGPSQPVHGAQRISCPGTGGIPIKKRRPPRSARVLLTTAREWLDSLPDEADEADDEDY